MSKDKRLVGQPPITDARVLGIPKMLLLGLQHMFAMFGATVLVPLLTGLSVSTTLLMAGLGTLLFHFLTKGKVPAFLGSSFAFLGGYAVVAPMIDGKPNVEMLPYACGGVFVAGLVYLIIAGLIKVFGIKKIMRFFPPVVTGPIIISIGLTLAPTAINNCRTDWLLAMIAVVLIIVCNIWGRGMVRIIPIIIGVVGSYLVAVILGRVDFTPVTSAGIIGVPLDTNMFAKFDISSIITIVPIALATVMEHIGDISAIGATTGKNYIANPGLHRTILGDGLATMIAAFFGAPANTTYGEEYRCSGHDQCPRPEGGPAGCCVCCDPVVFPGGGRRDYVDSGSDCGRCVFDSLWYDFCHWCSQYGGESCGSGVEPEYDYCGKYPCVCAGI